jgi:hypothetical protein
MLLNYNKAKFMQSLPNISHQSLDTIQLNTCKITSINSIKFSGIITESSLTWKDHIDYISSKVNSLGYMVHSLRPALDLKILKQIYFSYVQLVIYYGIMFRGNSPTVDLFL